MMNRLQKKCLIATAGSHFLLIVVILVGPGFFTAKTTKQDNTPVLELLPDNPTMGETTGVKDPAPPPPTQPVTAPPVPQPTPPKADVKPPEPVKTPDVKPVPETPEPPEKPVVDAPAPVVKPVVKPTKPRNLLKPMVRNTPAQPNTDDADAKAAEAEAKAAKAKADAKRRALTMALRNITDKSSPPSTRFDLPGNSAASAAQYGAFVKTVYENAWIDPDNASNDNADVKVSVTIARDGHVIEAHIINPSGDANVDASVRRTLDRVTFVKPFPEGDTETQRTFTIHFNLKAKRMLG
jgi:periplasmic protein TonB